MPWYAVLCVVVVIYAGLFYCRVWYVTVDFGGLENVTRSLAIPTVLFYAIQNLWRLLRLYLRFDNSCVVYYKGTVDSTFVFFNVVMDSANVQHNRLFLFRCCSYFCATFGQPQQTA